MADYSTPLASKAEEGRASGCLAEDDEKSLRESQALYGNMFHSSAFSAWRLDATGLRELLQGLRQRGITDLMDFAANNPSFAEDAMRGLIIKDVNQATLELFGAENKERLIGRSVEPFWIPGDYECFLRSIASSFNNEPSYRSETRMRTLDGKPIDVIFSRCASAELVAINQTIICMVDITDRVRAEHALVEMQSMIAHADRCCLMGELNSTIAHEVTQPLAAIVTYGQVGLRLLSQPDPNLEEVRVISRRVIADAQRAADIITRIRLMAVPNAIDYALISLNKTILETLTLLNPQLVKRSIKVTLTLAEELPDLMGDSIQLQQVLMNLATNAMHAMEETKDPRLRIRTYVYGSTMICAELEDNGHGIPRSDIDRIFERFFTTKRTGMGIGLPMCRSLIEAHGGTLSVDNRVEGGVRVTIWLPSISAIQKSP